MTFKTIQWCCDSAQIIRLPEPGFCNFHWPKSKRLCTGILLDGIRLDDVRCSKPPTFTTEKLDIPPNSIPFWNHLFAALHQYWISKKSQKHVVTFTPGPTSKCVSKSIPFQKSLKVYQHLPADGQRLLCSIQGKVVEDIGSFDRFRFQPLVVETECVGLASVVALNGWTACGWINLLEPWQ